MSTGVLDSDGPAIQLLRELQTSVQQLHQKIDNLARIVGERETVKPILPTTPDAWEPLLGELFVSRLSAQERRVCAHRLIGHSESEIAAALHLSRSAVKSHTARVVEKLGLHSVRELPLHVFREWSARRPGMRFSFEMPRERQE